jgi:hypothetical protein
MLYYILGLNKNEARIAQLVEQWTEDPRVTSSNLVLGIYVSLCLFRIL